jgi:putative transposase
MDFVTDTLSCGRRFRALNIIDCHSRECLAMEVDTSLSGERVVRVLERLRETRGLPQVIQTDNGPEFRGHKLDAWAYRNQVRLFFIEPGKPVQNAHIESFDGKLRNECLNLEWFTNLREARRIIEAWHIQYNQFRPHSSLNNLPPELWQQNQSENLYAEVGLLWGAGQWHMRAKACPDNERLRDTTNRYCIRRRSSGPMRG